MSLIQARQDSSRTAGSGLGHPARRRKPALRLCPAERRQLRPAWQSRSAIARASNMTFPPASKPATRSSPMAASSFSSCRTNERSSPPRAAAIAFDHEPDRGLFPGATFSGGPADAVLLVGAGTRSLDRLPVDAYPDLSPPMVEIITQWPGHAAEEVERLITVPVERGMNGIPQDDGDPLRIAVRIVGCGSHFRGRHRQLFRAPGSLQPDGRSGPARRRDAVGVAPHLALGPDLSLCAGKSRPFGDGTEDHRGLDGRTGIPRRAGCGRRFRFRRRQHAVPGAARPRQDRRHRPVGDSRSKPR